MMCFLFSSDGQHSNSFSDITGHVLQSHASTVRRVTVSEPLAQLPQQHEELTERLSHAESQTEHSEHAPEKRTGADGNAAATSCTQTHQRCAADDLRGPASACTACRHHGQERKWRELAEDDVTGAGAEWRVWSEWHEWTRLCFWAEKDEQQGRSAQQNRELTRLLNMNITIQINCVPKYFPILLFVGLHRQRILRQVRC